MSQRQDPATFNPLDFCFPSEMKDPNTGIEDENGWVKVEVWAESEAVDCGDYSIGPAFNAKYRRSVDGKIQVIEETYYVEEHGENGRGLAKHPMERIQFTEFASEADENDYNPSYEDYTYDVLTAGPCLFTGCPYEDMVLTGFKQAMNDHRFIWGNMPPPEIARSEIVANLLAVLEDTTAT